MSFYRATALLEVLKKSVAFEKFPFFVEEIGAGDSQMALIRGCMSIAILFYIKKCLITYARLTPLVLQIKICIIDLILECGN